VKGADYEREFQDSVDPYIRPEWIGWADSPADMPPMSSVHIDGTTAVAWGERAGVLYILDVYEVETSGAEPAIPSRTFRPAPPESASSGLNPLPMIFILVLIACAVIGFLAYIVTHPWGNRS
jgi:hypothetical protein